MSSTLIWTIVPKSLSLKNKLGRTVGVDVDPDPLLRAGHDGRIAVALDDAPDRVGVEGLGR